jgi:hypothetical protein
MALADEQRWFDSNRAFIAERYAGQYVLVKNQAVIGAYGSYEGAFSAGVAMFGATGGFLVKQALPDEHKEII